MNNRLAFLQAELLQHAVHPLGAEDTHQIVFQRQEEQRGARVALAAGAAPQLVVDAAAFMALGADDEQAPGGQNLIAGAGHLGRDIGAHHFRLAAAAGQFLLHPHVDIAAQLNIGAATGHVGGDGHRAGRAGLGDDHRLLLMKTRVKDLVGDFPLSQQAR